MAFYSSLNEKPQHEIAAVIRSMFGARAKDHINCFIDLKWRRRMSFVPTIFWLWLLTCNYWLIFSGEL